MNWLKWGAVALVVIAIWAWIREQYQAYIARLGIDSLDNLFLSVNVVMSGIRRAFKTTIFTLQDGEQREVSSKLMYEDEVTDPFVCDQLATMSKKAPTNLTPALTMMG